MIGFGQLAPSAQPQVGAQVQYGQQSPYQPNPTGYAYSEPPVRYTTNEMVPAKDIKNQ